MTFAPRFLRGQNVSKIYRGINGQSITALQDLSFSVDEGEIVCVTGKSGCGKSTLLNIIAGLVLPTSGEVLIAEQIPTVFRSHLGYLQQQVRLLPFRTALQNAALGVELRNALDASSIEKVTSLLLKFGLEGSLDAYPSELSGGMKQRVALARTLSTDCRLLLCDEPFVALDFGTRIQMEDALWNYIRSKAVTSVFVSHDLESAIAIADRIMLLPPKPHMEKRDILVSQNFRKMSPLARRQSSLFGAEFAELWSSVSNWANIG